jgi:hypothetical protein
LDDEESLDTALSIARFFCFTSFGVRNDEERRVQNGNWMLLVTLVFPVIDTLE